MGSATAKRQNPLLPLFTDNEGKPPPLTRPAPALDHTAQFAGWRNITPKRTEIPYKPPAVLHRASQGRVSLPWEAKALDGLELPSWMGSDLSTV